MRLTCCNKSGRLKFKSSSFIVKLAKCLQSILLKVVALIGIPAGKIKTSFSLFGLHNMELIYSVETFVKEICKTMLHKMM